MAFSAQGGSSTVNTLTFTNSNGVSFSNTNGSIWASVAAQTVQAQTLTVSAANTSYTIPNLSFSNANNVSFSISNNSQVYGSASFAQSTQGQTLTISAANTSYTVPNLSFSNANNVSFSISNNSQVYGSASFAQSTQPVAASGANGSFTFSTLSFSNAGGVSWSTSAGPAIYATVATNYAVSSASNVSAISAATNNTGGGTATLSGGVSFSNANNLMFYTSAGNAIVGSFSTSQSVQTQASGSIAGIGTTTTTQAGSTLGATLSTNGLSLAVPQWITTYAAQSNQTAGIYASSNTLGTTSSTYNATALSMVGSGVVSIGWSNGSLVFNAPAAGGDGVNIVSMATSTSGGATSGTTYSQSSGTIGLVAGSNITLQQSNNSIVIFGAGGGGATTGGMYLQGNTSNASSTTMALSSYNLSGLGAITLAASASSIQIQVPQTSSLVGTNGISVSTGGSTISVAPVTINSYAPTEYVISTSSQTFGALGATSGSVFLYPLSIPNMINVVFDNLRYWHRPRSLRKPAKERRACRRCLGCIRIMRIHCRYCHRTV